MNLARLLGMEATYSHGKMGAVLGTTVQEAGRATDGPGHEPELAEGAGARGRQEREEAQ